MRFFSSVFAQFNTKTIRWQLLISYLMIGMFPLLIVLAAFIATDRQMLTRSVNEELRQVALVTEGDLGRYLQERERLVEVIAQAPAVIQTAVDFPTHSSAILTQRMLANFASTAEFQHIWLLDTEGNVLVASSDLAGEVLPPALGHEAALDLAQGQPLYSAPFVHQPTEGAWHTFLAKPVFVQGEQVGILAVQEDSSAFVEALLGRAQMDLGVMGYVLFFVPDEQQRWVLFNPTDGLPTTWEPYETIQSSSDLRLWDSLYRQGVLNGRAVFAYYHLIEGTPWQLVVLKDKKTVYAPIKARENILAGVMAAILILILLFGRRAADILGAPIGILHEAVRQMAAGNLGARAQLTRPSVPREVRHLAADMNQMATQLQEMVLQLEGRLETGSTHLEATAEISRRIVALRNPTEMMPLVVSTIQTRLNLYFVALFLIDHDTQQATIQAVASASPEANKLLGYTLPLRLNSLVGWVVRHGRFYNCPIVSQDPHHQPHPALPQTSSELVLPLMRDGVVLGVLDLHAIRPYAFQEGYVHHLQGLADQITIALENGRLFQQTQQQAEEMQAAFRRAEEASLAKSTFLANMSHELRTPMNAIMGFAQLLERDNTLNNKQREQLRIISRSSEHLLTLINDVLEMSKIEAGATMLHVEPFDLHHTLTEIKELFGVRTEAKQLTMQFGMAADVPRFVKTDERKLRQVLINLLGNALKFTERGGISVRVGYEAADDLPATLHFVVEDTGEGIAAAEMNRLFQPFAQTASGLRRQEGTGLGLSITRQFVHLLGGRISVQSNVGEGTVVQFEIPITLAEQDEVREEASFQRVVGLALTETGEVPCYRVLVVDDRPENRDLMREWLTAVGFEVREAGNGREAIAQWETWNPHLIWMDLRMPILNGYEATQAIRARTDAPQPVIIALTASALEQDKAVFLRGGCNDFVRKPVREEVVLEKLAEHLGVRYEYESPAEQTTASTTHTLSTAELESGMATLPRELHHALWQAAVSINSDAAQHAIQQVGYYDAHLAHALTEMVENYRFDQLQRLLDKTGSSS